MVSAWKIFWHMSLSIPPIHGTRNLNVRRWMRHLFSRVHATLYVTMSIGPAVRPLSVIISVIISLLIFRCLYLKGAHVWVTARSQLPYSPYCPCPSARDRCCRVSGLVKHRGVMRYDIYDMIALRYSHIHIVGRWHFALCARMSFDVFDVLSRY